MKTIVAILLLALGLSFSAQALECKIIRGPTISYTAPLVVPNLTVGADVPVGTIIYKQRFRPQSLNDVYCDGSTSPYGLGRQFSFTSTPKGIAAWNGQPFPGKVYNTGLPGIGVAFTWKDQFTFPEIAPPSMFNNPVGQEFTMLMADFDINFIKIGEVQPGTISGSDLPSANIELYSQYGSVVTPIPWANVNFQGSINIISKACTTPNVKVPMGTVDISKFGRQGAVSDWVNWSITLSDCPKFYGTYPNSGTVANQDGSQITGTVVNNSLQTELNPSVPLDSSKGIIGITASADAATGVGIQIAQGNGVPLNLSNRIVSPLTVSSPSVIKIPFQARYIQTGASSPTPGPANATMTFNIFYY